ncbi:hypothetical protein LTR91_022548 [Friedmanniomyces endolithicus]|uniref:Uncharacterized protein n=1 Tax=Friedmanniomyces endolithicus TaxID=329885 RepID=A0AAN6H4N1_9PEZI|nr:hypothetical protein LTR59_012118 [Friedmanniomyces endolithicus]KAK0842529.1 hypothetical protein LTS02_016441 [Friedmanniomyces endolithicus]KAK0880326.1 hypothetical protein LTR87_005766 [Friedmanniomyces endolithicus]KAK0888170.1 hypothetical protein LTR02_016565 [Friedmanniomyces endolithicus]KAK0897540.1 hypothetical protein LTR57_022070 [Friedmanniomyces endolithicus]
MPRQSRQDQPKSSSTSDRDSVPSMTTSTDQQPIMTPGTTAPNSEAGGVDESAVTDPESGDLERLAALYADLATNFDGKRSHYIDFLVSSFWLRQKKVAEVSRIDELVVMAHQLRGTLDYADLGESAVGVGGDSAKTSTTLNRLHDPQERVAARDGDVASLRHQLAARGLEIERLQVRCHDLDKRVAAHDGEMDSLRNQLATRQPPTNEGVARLLSLSNCFMAHGRFNDPFLDYMAAEERRLNVLVAWQVWVSAMLAWLCLMLAWLFYKISAAP